MFPGSKPVKLLFVEDEHSDAGRFEQIFQDVSFYSKVSVLKYGKSIAQFLHEAIDLDSESNVPDLILLDMNHPLKQAFEKLEIIKSDVKFRRIPVIILSSEKNEDLARISYEMLANSFVVKPDSDDEFVEMVKSLEKFWLKIVSLPTI